MCQWSQDVEANGTQSQDSAEPYPTKAAAWHAAAACAAERCASASASALQCAEEAAPDDKSEIDDGTLKVAQQAYDNVQEAVAKVANVSVVLKRKVERLNCEAQLQREDFKLQKMIAETVLECDSD